MNTSPAVYFCPHQDDEVLTLSLDIIKHISAGRPVYIVLYTTGNSTGAINALNGTVVSSWWGVLHNPTFEGYSPLTPIDIQTARNTEFKTACTILGIPQTNIIYDQLEDTDVTVANLKTLFMKYVAQFGVTASYKTMSKYDTQIQHTLGAQALLELYNEGVVSDVRFWVSRYDIMTNTTVGRQISAPTTSELDTIKRACKAYCAWSPLNGSYAIGHHSVATQFTSTINNPVFKYLLPTD